MMEEAFIYDEENYYFNKEYDLSRTYYSPHSSSRHLSADTVGDPLT